MREDLKGRSEGVRGGELHQHKFPMRSRITRQTPGFGTDQPTEGC